MNGTNMSPGVDRGVGHAPMNICLLALCSDNLSVKPLLPQNTCKPQDRFHNNGMAHTHTCHTMSGAGPRGGGQGGCKLEGYIQYIRLDLGFIELPLGDNSRYRFPFSIKQKCEFSRNKNRTSKNEFQLFLNNGKWELMWELKVRIF